MSKVIRLNEATLEVMDEFRAIIINNLENELNDSINTKTFKEILKKDIDRYNTDDNYLLSLALLQAIEFNKQN